MSDAISRRIKQLENQNKKFKKLLESTLQITNEDTAKCLQLKNEANFLKKVVSDLENQKKQLEDELKLYLVQDGVCDLEVHHAEVDIQAKLNNALNDIQRESSEIQELITEDGHLKELIADLENEKERLLNDIQLVKKADAENNALAQENLKLKQELALLESQCPTTAFSCSSSGYDLVKKLESIENLKLSLQDDMNTAKLSPTLLGNPVENTVLELKISGLEKQKETILRNLRASLLLAASEISLLHSNTSDDQLRRLLNELDIHKTILMMNLNDLKEMHVVVEAKPPDACVVDHCTLNNSYNPEDQPGANQQINFKRFLDCNEDDNHHFNSSEPKPSSSFSSDSSEIVERVTEIRDTEEPMSLYDQGSHELPTVSEEDETTPDLLAEREQLIEDINRLELERSELLEQIESVNSQRGRHTNPDELRSTPMREDSSEEVNRLSLDDATNQLYANQEQLLAQRIKELEDDNDRIRRNLNFMLAEAQSDKEDFEVLEEGERLIRGHHKGGIGDDVEH